MLTAVYLINRTPTKLLDSKTPYEMLFGIKPTYEHIRVFGSLFYAHNHSRARNKFDARAHKSIFLGYPHGQKGWKVYNLENKWMYVPRDVVFFDNAFPWANIVIILLCHLKVFIYKPKAMMTFLYILVHWHPS